MRTLNAHRILAGTSVTAGYINALDVGARKERALASARDLVRLTLKKGLRERQKRGVVELVEQRFVAKASAMPPMTPRFRMQGSMKYRTLNDPACKPPQEIDVDDGVYLPTSFVTASGGMHPVLSSKAYFSGVEKILEPLCAQQGWQLDRSKPCCVRVRLTDEAHIDLPLYAIPDDQFVQMTEDTAIAKADAIENFELSDRDYRALREDTIMLARRNADWLESDPRKIEDWFLEAIDDHDEVIRRVCRYLKGWRDHQLERSKISSLLLMACAVATFDDLKGTFASNRDDLALLSVARALPNQFAADVMNPVIPDQVLNADWSYAERREFMRLAEALKTEIEAALGATYNKSVAINHLRSAFGSRIPNNPDLLVIDTNEDEVLSYPRARVAAPAVPRTTSG